MLTGAGPAPLARAGARSARVRGLAPLAGAGAPLRVAVRALAFGSRVRELTLAHPVGARPRLAGSVLGVRRERHTHREASSTLIELHDLKLEPCIHTPAGPSTQRLSRPSSTVTPAR